MKQLFAVALVLLSCGLGRAATRLKELVTVEGVRDNQLIGYGLVVGLNGTGDRRQTVFSAQSLANLLTQMGVSVPAVALRVNNTAAVMVTGTLPPFAQLGARIDVTAAAMGDASNLQGGLLILTSLRGIDGQVYAVAQGAVVTGGFSAGGGGNRATINHPTVGRVPGGATIERAPQTAALSKTIRLQLRMADFSTSSRVAKAVNTKFGVDTAKAENAGSVQIQLPAEYSDRSTEFLAEMEHLTVESDRLARISINERTGTIVMGRDVRIAPVAIMHGTLAVQISTDFNVSQPAPFSQGSTQVVPQTDVKVKEEKTRNVMLPQGASVDELVRALSAIGATPRDVIAILQNLKSAGALDAEIEVL
jgi:flagellar P-ring protein precursor FlgI